MGGALSSSSSDSSCVRFFLRGVRFFLMGVCGDAGAGVGVGVGAGEALTATGPVQRTHVRALSSHRN